MKKVLMLSDNERNEMVAMIGQHEIIPLANETYVDAYIRIKKEQETQKSLEAFC